MGRSKPAKAVISRQASFNSVSVRRLAALAVSPHMVLGHSIWACRRALFFREHDVCKYVADAYAYSGATAQTLYDFESLSIECAVLVV